MAKTQKSKDSDTSGEINDQQEKLKQETKPEPPEIQARTIPAVQQRLEEYQYLIENGALPPHIDNPAKALSIEMAGKELGIGFMAACANLVPIAKSDAVGYKIGLNGIIAQWCLERAGVYWKTLKDFEKDGEISAGVPNYATEIEFWRYVDGPNGKEKLVERGRFTRKDTLMIEIDKQGKRLAQKDVYKNYERWMFWWRAFDQGSDRIAGWAKLGLKTIASYDGVLNMKGEVVQMPEGALPEARMDHLEVTVNEVKPVAQEPLTVELNQSIQKEAEKVTVKTDPGDESHD